MFALDGLKRKHSQDLVYRSNSSLDLVPAEHFVQSPLRREYGSHGSIDVLGGAHISRNHAVTGGLDEPKTDHVEHVDGPIGKNLVPASSPKLRIKFHKFWGGNGTGSSIKQNKRQIPLDDTIISMNSLTESYSNVSIDCPDGDDHNKRKHFAHHDCQSLIANLSYAAKLRGILLGRRRNTTTGASAASLLQSRSEAANLTNRNNSNELSKTPNEDGGDSGCQQNDLVDGCPFFTNEIGGEEERSVSLSWKTARFKRNDQKKFTPSGSSWHRPCPAYGLSILEFPAGQSHWKQQCPFSVNSTQSLLPVENQDLGALFYRKYFYGQDHQNWFGMDEHLGPVAISIKKERVELPVILQANNSLPQQPNSGFVSQYRLIVRTSELLTLRGSVLEDVIPNMKPSANIKTFSAKEVFEYVTPEIHLACLRLGLSGTGAEEQLLRLDEQCLTRHYKVGIMYCRKGQSTEEDMYNNQEAGPAFVEFLQSLGQTVRLKGFDKYKAGLDNKTDSTGLYSVYAVHQDCEVMFHVSTMLPYTPNNRQQLLRKRHIGNDIVTIVFQEPGAQAFTPKNIRSQFQHVFVVVRAINPCSENTHYRIAVSRSKEVPMFGPPLVEGALYPKSKYFTELLLSKVINAENAAHMSPKFSTMATRTRQEYLKDLAINYITATPLDTGQKFSIFSSLLMKSTNGSNPSMVSRPNEQSRVDSSREYHVGGALCWPVAVQDEGAGGTTVDCFFGISTDSVVLIEEATRQIVFVSPIKSLLAWATSSGGWVRLFYHCGECVRLQAAGADDGEASAMVRRLTALGVRAARRLAVARGAGGQLGFHVRRDGLVTGVAAGGGAYRAGLRRSHRLLEICRAAVASLPHERMVDLLKTAAPVALAITPEPSPPLCRCEDDDASVAMTTSPPPSQTSSPRRVARPQPAQPTNTTNTLQQELMRLIEPETAPGIVTMARPAQVVPPAPTSSLTPSTAANLPLPDARALDWPALVDTATRAMLQFNDEQQYASLDNSTDTSLLNNSHDMSSDTPTEPWTEPPLDTCGCGLAPRVHALEQEVSRLRRHNARLRDESARAVRQLRRFTQWFVHTVDRPP